MDPLAWGCSIPAAEPFLPSPFLPVSPRLRCSSVPRKRLGGSTTPSAPQHLEGWLGLLRAPTSPSLSRNPRNSMSGSSSHSPSLEPSGWGGLHWPLALHWCPTSSGAGLMLTVIVKERLVAMAGPVSPSQHSIPWDTGLHGPGRGGKGRTACAWLGAAPGASAGTCCSPGDPPSQSQVPPAALQTAAQPLPDLSGPFTTLQPLLTLWQELWVLHTPQVQGTVGALVMLQWDLSGSQGSRPLCGSTWGSGTIQGVSSTEETCPHCPGHARSEGRAAEPQWLPAWKYPQ